MKANLARREPEQLAAWERIRLYDKVQEARSAASEEQRFILHDGPPYANGRIHIGHALNKILKDIIIKARLMSGFAAPFIPGWDCHGLPIEHQVMKDAGKTARTLSRLEIRQRCRAYAEKFLAIQREEFQRLGCLGDWDHPYLTMDPHYEAAIIREFGKCVAAGGVYRAKKPVLWCWRDETALAEAEVEYEEHTSPSIYVKFPVKNPAGKFSVDPQNGTHIVIWTTTPWTLVANQAIALHPRYQYRLVTTPAGEVILAQNLIESCMNVFGYVADDYRVTPGSWSGQELTQVVCQHPWLDHDVPIVLGEHVTLEQGTGCVHTAPGHGQEDYVIGLKYGLKVYAPVDHRGKFEPEAGEFTGQQVFQANQAIIDRLKTAGRLIRADAITHSYPHCWRCKNPVIFRATEQWFISMEKTALRERALREIDDAVTWIPKWGRDRIYGMIQGRPDWCISRQRAWGVPIVAFACQNCHEVLSTPDIINYVANLIEQGGGSDLWFSQPAEELLPKGTTCPKCHATHFQPLHDILDVWFESGVSHAAVLKRRPELRWPADLYLEGSDQHRGWFHSALLTGIQTDGHAPYRSVLTHGFVIDGEGKKMSKSAGNVVAPQEVIIHHGAEILRLWVAASDYREDVRISEQILSQLVETYRRTRNSCRYLLGNLADFDPGRDRLGTEELEEIDRWALHQLQEVTAKVLAAYDQYEFHLVVHTINHFCATDLSAFYFDILKDRLYCESKRSRLRRSAQTVLFNLLQSITHLIAPILSFTADEVWQAMPDAWRPAASRDSVLLSSLPVVNPVNRDQPLTDRWAQLIAVREEVSKALEAARKAKTIGSSLDAAIEIGASHDLLELLNHYTDQLPALFIVSQVTLRPLKQDEPERTRANGASASIKTSVTKASGRKCVRCWKYDTAVGQNASHPELCGRCVGVVQES